MKQICNFHWIGDPKPLKRHRQGKGGHSYDPSKKDKQDFLLAVSQHIPKEITEKPLGARILITVARPKSHYGTGKNSDKIKPKFVNAIPVGDIDNYEKFIYDAMNGVFFKDDRQIVCHTVGKVYGLVGGLDISIREMI